MGNNNIILTSVKGGGGGSLVTTTLVYFLKSEKFQGISFVKVKYFFFLLRQVKFKMSLEFFVGYFFHIKGIYIRICTVFDKKEFM